LARRYWKISAGDESKHWQSFIRDSLIAFGTWDEADLNQYANRDELKGRIIAYSLRNRGKSSNSYVELWNFYVAAKEGDFVVLYRKKGIVACGEIIGPYEYKPKNKYDGGAYYHTKRMKWTKVFTPPMTGISDGLILRLSKPPDTFHEIRDETCIAEILRLCSCQN